jgi:signal transduction histidine kinase
MGLIASLFGYLVLAGEPVANTAIAVGSAIVLSGALVYVGYWLYGSELSGELVWRVAQYSSVGLSVPVAVGVLLTVVGVRPALAYLFPSLFINTIAAGAVIGLLLGSVRELRREHRMATKLNQRNSVLNRVLRHNLRNDTSVILGYLDTLREIPEGEEADEAYRTIVDRVEELIDLSESARRIEHIDEGSEGGPIDLAALVEERAEIFGATDEDVSFELELPDEAWAGVGPLCKSAIDNLIENSIEHTAGEATVRIAVGPTRGNGNTIEVAVADDGPGIPVDEVRALHGSAESQLHHGSGLGLWVAKWVTESYGGEIRFDEHEEGGSVVTLELPAASRVDRLLGTA